MTETPSGGRNDSDISHVAGTMEPKEGRVSRWSSALAAWGGAVAAIVPSPASARGSSTAAADDVDMTLGVRLVVPI